jgi:hypothetical protein
MTVLALAVFSGALRDLDVDAAAEDLRKAGYTVHRMPSEFVLRVCHPLDDFIEATFDIDAYADDKTLDAIRAEVDAIVDPFGGLVDEWGNVPRNRKPFSDLFVGDPRNDETADSETRQ